MPRGDGARPPRRRVGGRRAEGPRGRRRDGVARPARRPGGPPSRSGAPLGRRRAPAEARRRRPRAGARALLVGSRHRCDTRGLQNGRVTRALITGIGGQDGSYLTELLLEEGYEVVGLVRPGAQAYENLVGLEGRHELYEADLLNQASLAQAIRAAKPDEIYNLAAPSFVPESWDRPVQTAEFAAVGATALLESVRNVDPTIRFYQASSSEIFGEPR